MDVCLAIHLKLVNYDESSQLQPGCPNGGAFQGLKSKPKLVLGELVRRNPVRLSFRVGGSVKPFLGKAAEVWSFQSGGQKRSHEPRDC